MHVFVRDAPSFPAFLPGVTIYAVAGDQTFTAITGADGCAFLSDPALTGTADVHFFLDGYEPSAFIHMTTAMKYTPPKVKKL